MTKVRYGLFVPDEPSAPRLVAPLSVRFPRAMAQARKLAQHYGADAFVAHVTRGASGDEPSGERHSALAQPRSVQALTRAALQRQLMGQKPGWQRGAVMTRPNCEAVVGGHASAQSAGSR